MAVRKEIIVLNGGGHKGVVKIAGVAGKENRARVSCSLDFRPSGASLYLIGENIAQIPLNDVNCEVEVPFCANSDTGCVLRSSSLTMFGGRGVKSEMLARIEAWARDCAAEKAKVSAEKNNVKKTEERVCECKVRQPEQTGVTRCACAEDGKNCECNKDCNADAEQAEQQSAEVCEQPKDSAKEKKAYVGANVSAGVNPLGDWTKYDGNNFYYAIKPQIDEMFICYPEDKLLGDTVPNSKWVRVDAVDGFYVVGLLYDESEPSYICYGVPQYPVSDGSARRCPPELENMCVWLPVGSDNEMDGYWMIYQSARTGEIIK